MADQVSTNVQLPLHSITRVAEFKVLKGSKNGSVRLPRDLTICFAFPAIDIGHFVLTLICLLMFMFLCW